MRRVSGREADKARGDEEGLSHALELCDLELLLHDVTSFAACFPSSLLLLPFEQFRRCPITDPDGNLEMAEKPLRVTGTGPTLAAAV